MNVADCELIALLNPNAFPEFGWFGELIDAARANTEFSSFASLTFIVNTPDRMDGAGDSYHVSGVPWRRG